MTVLVTGATGSVGRHVVSHLLRGGHRVRALSRDPTRADLPEEVEVVAGDLTEVDTLAPVFDGVRAAHLINFGHGYRPLGNGAQIVELALRAGVRRVTTLGGWEEGTLEPAVRASELEWTCLRPVEFMGNTLVDWGERLRRDGVIREPFGDRESAPVHECDIGAVAAVALTEDGHAGATYTITGPEVLTPRHKISILAEATGRDLRFEELTPDQARRQWATELPDLMLLKVFGDAPELDRREMIEFVLRVYGSADERAHTVTDTVPRVTGSPATTFARWAADNVESFRR